MRISLEHLKEAVHIKESIATLEARLENILSGVASSVSTVVEKILPVKRGRRKMTASARAKIAEAQRARWARQKGTSAAPRKAGGLTAEGRARLAAIMKARWAARRKAGAPALNARKRK